MTSPSKLILKSLKKVYTKLYPVDNTMNCDLEGQLASDLIRKIISSKKPSMIARFGAVELNIMVACANSNGGFKKYLRYIKDEISTYEINNEILTAAKVNAGIFPKDPEILHQFYNLMKEDIKQLDVLGSWLNYENDFISNHRSLIKIPLKDIEPYYHENPWTKALKDKKVLVIHPFTESIKQQYNKRELLFNNPDLLPKFNLITLQSVQSIAGENNLPYKDWFEALNYMKNQISQIDFDVAIIGCGAYGFPLAAYIKRIGKQSIHMGGSTQILFGIKGKRWENNNFISQLMNQHWIRPNTNETPLNNNLVEGSCYW